MTKPSLLTKDNHKIVIALGDPAGIGLEIILKALFSNELPKEIKPLLVGCKKSIEMTYSKLKEKGVNELADPDQLEIKNFPLNHEIELGHPNAITGAASFKWLTKATELVLKGEGRALVTAPIAKHAWYDAGHFYGGQTERLAEISSSKRPSMLFTAVSPFNKWRLNTLLATTHIPLNEVTNQLTPELINFKLKTLISFCKRFKKNPKISIAGLNPHAGENGHIGKEEIEWLKPLIKNLQETYPETFLNGPLPPDTCWLSAKKAWSKKPDNATPDGILALYHDQGLIPVKLIAFDEAVNTTLGLPFLRTSPDHGTAFDIAGQGLANPKSMIAAIKTGWELTN